MHPIVVIDDCLLDEPSMKTVAITSSHTATTAFEDSSLSSFAEESDSEFANSSRSSLPLHWLPQETDIKQQQSFDQQRQRVTGGVQFSEQVLVHDTIHRNDISPEEKHACWYQRHEFAAIREAAERVLDQLEAGEVNEEVLLSVRGLENFTEEGAEATELAYAVAAIAVLQEQELSNDPTIIAKNYRKVTLKSRFPARQRALRDRQEVELILRGVCLTNTV
eukprot:Nitzschia sp. Nitz4//scaffold130_size63480//4606//5268//NITZ4_006237-RA/size63480-processed-gene-0.26-mRNA-1//-1//CDS//3329535153//5536//frame0